MFFILILQNIVLFFQTKRNFGFNTVLFRQKTRKFLLFHKSKMLQFSRIKKMCCFKRAIFCIIQRKVKRRCILLIQIFNLFCVGCVRGKIMYFSFRTNFKFIYRFRPSSVLCSFFYSTGWAVKNDERVVRFKLLLFKLVITRKVNCWYITKYCI